MDPSCYCSGYKHSMRFARAIYYRCLSQGLGTPSRYLANNELECL